MFRSIVEHTIEIDAPPKAVYDVLTRKDEWASWSSLLVSREAGPITLGGRLLLGLRTREASYDFEAQVTELRPNETFEWLAKTFVSGVMDGRHRFELTALPNDRCRMRNVEFYTGLLVPIVMRTRSMKAAPEGFQQMNNEIAARAEKMWGEARAEHRPTEGNR